MCRVYKTELAGDSTCKFCLSSSYVLTSGSFVVYSGPLDHPSSLSGKTCFFAVLFLGTTVYYHWQAAIISYLSVSKTTLPFMTMEQMLSDTDYKVRVRLLNAT